MMSTQKEMISRSVDARALKSDIRLKAVVSLIVMVSASVMSIVGFWKYPSEMIKALLVFNIVCACCYTPAILISVILLRRLVKRSETYLFGEAILTDYRTSGRRFYFHVTMKDETGKRVTGDTDAIYRTGSMIAGFEDWHNKRVLAAYDPETERVIVIERVHHNSLD